MESSQKYAYHLEGERNRRKSGETSTRDEENAIWISIRQLKIPNSINNFIWRGCHDILPTKQKLFLKENCGINELSYM